jgi:hypothetical protein
VSIQPEDYPRALESIQEQLRRARDPEQSAEPERAQTTQATLGRILYRVIRGSSPSSDDFASNLTKCLPMRGAESKEPLLWAGLSMFDTPDAATRNALRFRGRIGTHLAELVLPAEDDARVLVRQTLRPGHFTVLCCDISCISFITHVQPIVGLSA